MVSARKRQRQMSEGQMSEYERNTYSWEFIDDGSDN